MSTTVPLIPDTAPFTSEQRAWLNGFFAGLFSRAPAGSLPQPASLDSQPTAALAPLTILYGSQTGTAESLAKRAAKEAGKRGFAATVVDMAQTDAARLAQERNVLVITSTYGDGEPPDNAKALHTTLARVCHSLDDKPKALAGVSQPSSLSSQLNSVRFSVCSLGDTNYTQFCKCGADFDSYLEKLGAARITPRADCDLDYEEKFTAWLNAALAALARSSELEVSILESESSSVSQLQTPNPKLQTETAYSKKKPFPAPLLTSRNLNAAGSAKQVHHVELDLSGSGVLYEAGDALGVFPHNCPALVGEVLTALGCDGEEAVPAPDGSTTSLRHALTELYDLGKPSADLLARLVPQAVPVSQSSALNAHLSSPHHVIDALHARPDLKIAPAEFVRALRKLQPRLYSISSSPRAHAGQVHLTVGAVHYDLHGRTRKGVCSTFLADRVVSGQSRIAVFVHPNKAFRLPASGDTAMIMVGPGTGIAPFRAFLHERKATGARGRNWLFFGDQKSATDFLYRDELAALMHDGVLTRLDTAFSRDQPEKIYVQQRMLEHATEIYTWLEQGAHFYVCGDASRMAKDVDAALHTVVERAGGKTAEQAVAYVQALKAAKRYARDVY
jgi:sulfite reductase (NADPH) flavoprotein alpha-component